MLFAGGRFIIAGIMVIAGMSIARGKFLHPEARDIKAVLLLSLFQTILQYLFFYQGLSKASGVTCSIVFASGNFIAVLFSSLLFRSEKLTPRKVFGCLAGFIGVAVINLGSGDTEGLAFSLGGEGCILVSAVAASMSTCLVGTLGKRHDPVMLSGWQFLVGGIVLACAAAAAGGSLEIPGLSEAGQPDLTRMLPAVGLLLYMGFISAMAYSLWSRLLTVHPVSRASVFGFMNPIFGFFLSALLLDEGKLVNPTTAALALALVCGGIIVVNLPHRTTNSETNLP